MLLTSFCVEALNVDSKGSAFIKDIVKVLLVQRGSEERVSKHARCQRFGLSVPLCSQGLGRFYYNPSCHEIIRGRGRARGLLVYMTPGVQRRNDEKRRLEVSHG